MPDALRTGQVDLVGRLRDEVRGEVRAGEPLAAYTTMRVGGPAMALVRAEGPDDLAAVARICQQAGVRWLILGRGSNLLVADEGWPGVAVVLGRGLRGVEFDGSHVIAGAAEPMPSLAARVARQQLGGLAFGIAIPGTLGGAVRMNAGAHGREMRHVLEWAEVVRLSDAGRVERFAAADLKMRYRETSLPADAVVIRARLALEASDPASLERDMDEMRSWRRAHQPISQPSCGSVFRNPPGDSAGRLIDGAGLKGHRVGGAAISDVHANFITAGSGATAADVHQVIRDAQAAVKRHAGVVLQPEVVLAGFGDDRP